MMPIVKWYERPLRIAALQCNDEEGKTLRVSRDAQHGARVVKLPPLAEYELIVLETP